MSSVILARSAIIMDTLYAKICMRLFVCAMCMCYIGYICMCKFVCVRLLYGYVVCDFLYVLFVCAICMCRGMCCTVFVCVSEKVGCFHYYQIALRPSLSLSALGTYHRAYSCLKVFQTMCLCGYYLCTVGDISLELCSIGFVCIFVCITVCIGFPTCTVCTVCLCVT